MKVFSQEKLKQALSDPKLSMPGLARITGMTPQTLRRYRNGEREPISSALFIIAGALGVPVDYFSDLVSDSKLQQQKLPLREERKTRKKSNNQAQQGAANA